MTPESRHAIVVSASSDIGTAMCLRWAGAGWDVIGTYRTEAPGAKALENSGVRLVRCDLSEAAAVGRAGAELRSLCPRWDVLVLAPGTQEPVGPFEECEFDEWQHSVQVNFSGQLHIIHELLPVRNRTSPHGSCVLFFAGGGTNNAVLNYSAYTVSKIALIKMTELLAAELPDTRFAIVGPGWVKTKIHGSTLRAGRGCCGENYDRTVAKLAGDECTPMADVLDCCDWLIEQPPDVVSGRNFSVVHDRWGSAELAERLRDDQDLYKLRRSGNNVLPRRS